jgi:hypothetical protein
MRACVLAGEALGGAGMVARVTRVLVAAAVAAVIAGLLYVNLDSGKVSPEPAARLFSLPLLGLAAIFGVRAWTESLRPGSRLTAFFAGLALGAGGYGIVRLLLFR